MRAILLSRLAWPLPLTLTILLTAGGASAQLVSDGATATINGTATNIASFLVIGNTGPNTTLIVTNGGSVTADNAGIGGTTTSSNNLVAVSGASSRMTTPGGGSVFRIGDGSAFNRLLISEGGAVTTGYGVVGYPVGASNNSVIVTGSGSAWTNSVLYVGEAAKNNSVTVANGGRLQVSDSTIGFLAGASNNWVTVTGPNSLWSTVNNVLVGDADGQNRLFVNNGGKVTSGASIIVGNQSSSSSNLLSVGGSTVTATNASGTGTLDVRRGNVEFNDGLITADRLLLTNSAGSFTFNGGTLITRGATINNGQNFVVGANAGTGPAGASFANTTATTIPGAGTVGAASPYPSVINVANLGGIITKVTVTLSNLSHTFPNDLEVLLVGPDGQKVMLMSDAGGGGPGVANVNLTFADAAAVAVPASNPLSGTYRPTDLVPGDLLPLPAPPGSYSTNLATFNGSSANGAWSLFVSDDTGGDSGSLGAWSLNIVTAPAVAASANLANGALITINDVAPATPYPSVINVTNLAGVVSRVTVTVSNFTHSKPYDIDLVLVNPEGAAVALMRNAGEGLAGATLTFDDAAPSTLPFSGSIVSGTYRPTTYIISYSLPAPAPAGPYATDLAIFNGSNPNGVWSLFANDHNGGIIGAINNGWSLQLETITPATWDVRSNATPTTVGNILIVGNTAANATLLVTNGGILSVGFKSVLGNLPSASNNLAIIAGPNSIWHAAELNIGALSSFNTMLITNGGTVENDNEDASIGYESGANYNHVTVTGPNSAWTNISSIEAGGVGSFNSLRIANGGQVRASSYSYIGHYSAAISNRIEVDGSNSLLTVGEFYMGDNVGSDGNLLFISSGGRVTDSTGSYIGTRGNGNQAVVTGPNSLWSSAQLHVGYEGAGNALLLTNGGAAQAAVVFVGTQPLAADNLLTVAGGTLRATNASGTAAFDIRRGTNVLNAGLIEVDNLLLTNAAGFFEFNGGTLNARTANAANGAVFTVGNGSSAATYHMSGVSSDNHLFNNGLTIANNAVLTGSGSLLGLTVLPGGTVSPGASIGSIYVNSQPNLQGQIIMEIAKNGATLTKDFISVGDNLVYGGALTVTNLGPTALALGDSFQIFFSFDFYGGAFSSISLPPLPAGLKWSNQLLANGTIAVVNKTAPQISGLTKSSTNLIYNVTGGSPGAPWYRLTSTNVALPLANWTTNGTGVFDWVGNATITNGINFAEPQRYFRISAP